MYRLAKMLNFVPASNSNLKVAVLSVEQQILLKLDIENVIDKFSIMTRTERLCDYNASTELAPGCTRTHLIATIDLENLVSIESVFRIIFASFKIWQRLIIRLTQFHNIWRVWIWWFPANSAIRQIKYIVNISLPYSIHYDPKSPNFPGKHALIPTI